MPRVLQVHNRYLAGLGGEDTVIAEESKLLSSNGFEVDLFEVQTDQSAVTSKVDLLATAAGFVWSNASKESLRERINEFRPDVVHVHNTFPKLSPSIFWAIPDPKIRVVYTLHNYRLTCANGLLLRSGVPCELCVGHLMTSGIRHKCYKDSAAGSATHAISQFVHRTIGTYTHKVDAFIVLSEFARDIFIRAGLPPGKLHVKPNFVDPDLRPVEPATKQGFVFVGKIVAEKGLDRLLFAWKHANVADSLQIIGDGVEKKALEEKYPDVANVSWRGWLDRSAASSEVRSAKFLIVSSIWYEGFPMVIVEAMLVGTPLIVPNLGAMPEMIGGDEGGIVYDSKDPEGLKNAIQRAHLMPLEEYRKRAEYVYMKARSEYSAETNLKSLREIYDVDESESMRQTS